MKRKKYPRENKSIQMYTQLYKTSDSQKRFSIVSQLLFVPQPGLFRKCTCGRAYLDLGLQETCPLVTTVAARDVNAVEYIEVNRSILLKNHLALLSQRDKQLNVPQEILTSTISKSNLAVIFSKYIQLNLPCQTHPCILKRGICTFPKDKSL